MSQARIDWSQFWYPSPIRIFTPGGGLARIDCPLPTKSAP